MWRRCAKLFLILICCSFCAAAFLNPATSAYNSDLQVEILPSITVSLTDVALEGAIDTLSVNNTNLSVSSNNTTGYITTFSTNTNYSSLDNTNSSATIPTLSNTVAKNSFPTNYWGYSLDDATYKGIPAKNATADTLTELSSSTPGALSSNLYFAAKINGATEAGIYKNTVLVTVTPNYTPISIAQSYVLSGKTRIAANDGHSYFSIQDMSPEICNRIDKLDDQMQVVDERDGKVYWIAKLRDGNCWMTQNLDFDITANNVIPETSNVDVAWNSSSAHPPQVTSTGEIFNNNSDDGTYSFDQGDYYMPDGTYDDEEINCLTVNGGEDCHYHLGNSYQYNTATAGEGSSDDGWQYEGYAYLKENEHSICPKGWILPSSSYSNINYSFSNLLSAYNIGSSNTAALFQSPLYFNKSGIISPGRFDAGGIYWTSDVGDDDGDKKAYILYISDTGSFELGYDLGRLSYGASVRCVARLEEMHTVTFSIYSGQENRGTLSNTSIKVPHGSTVTDRYNSDGSESKIIGNKTVTATPKVDFKNTYGVDVFMNNTCGDTIVADCNMFVVFDEQGSSRTYMQDITPAICETVPIGVENQLIDSRDNKLYWVTKLADNNCWMTQNLDYDIKNTGNIIAKNNGATSTWSPNTATSVGAYYTDTTPNGTQSYDPGDIYDTGNTSGSVTCTSSSNGGYNCHYHLGNYYQYNAARAGSSVTTGSGNYSICPKNWFMTSPSVTGSFDALFAAYNLGQNASKMQAAPLYFVRHGYIGSGQLNNVDYGYYWTALGTDANNASSLSFDNSTISLGASHVDSRSLGMHVRCRLVDQITSLDTITNMQQMTPDVVENTEEGKSKQLIDTRDNKLYWVTKLKDGKIWMTQNLDYDIKTTNNVVSNNDGTTTTWSPNRATSTSVYNNTSSTGTYSYDPGSYYSASGTSSTNTAITCTTTTNGGNNCHYHIGNYYQFNAATAGSATNNQDATRSICPQGWRLPTSNSYTADYSFGKMTNAQGITNSANASSDSSLRSSPLYYVRTGYVYSGSVRSRGSNGTYWSSRAASSSSNAYYLNFTSTSVAPSTSGARSYGRSVRCVSI